MNAFIPASIFLVLAGFLSAVGSLAAAEGPQQFPSRLKASDPATWKQVPYRAVTPTGGVTLDKAGLFHRAMENNIAYLIDSFSVNHMLWPFRVRAGQKDPPDDRPQVGFWDVDLRGSSAGRFLMGAGNTLRWMEHPELRRRMEELIDGVEACRGLIDVCTANGRNGLTGRAILQANINKGYILAYPPDKVRSEEPNYGRAWFTHGLIEAAIAGNRKAHGLLRGHADWFNQWDMLPKLLYHSSNSHQGHIASTRTYFSPIGKPEDLQVAEKYYVCDWWMDQLIARRPEGVWKYPLRNPHSYLITSFEAYLDHYRATGDKRYLDTALGAWDLIHDNWEHVGGSMAICEGRSYPPRSYYVNPEKHTGETCGSVFWIKFCQRFHQLYPLEVKYVDEIEKSIYNVCLANQAGGRGIRYHAFLEGHCDRPTMNNTCCEGQGTRLYGSLPETIYSIAEDGLYVDLFEPSTIEWKLGGQPVKLAMQTKFPFQPDVTLRLSVTQPVGMKLRVRVPAWAAADVPIRVGGQQVAVGKPGTYQTIDRTWADGDVVSFTLPMAFRMSCYSGDDQIEGHKRYALEYGPILLALVGPLDENRSAHVARCPSEVATWLRPKPDRPLCFTIDGDARHEYVPYWQVADRPFTVYPVIEPVTIRGAAKFVKSTTVELISAIPGTAICYTTDGSEPTAQSARYAGPFELKDSATVRVRLFADAAPRSEVVGQSFLRQPLWAPTIRPTRDGRAIEIVAPPQFAATTIHYTADGSDPTEKSPTYKNAIPLPGQKTVFRARSFLPGEAPSPAVEFSAGGPDYPWPMPDVHLPDLDAVRATVGWKTVQKNRNIVGKPLILAGRQYAKGMGVHAVSELAYAIKPEYKRFVALTGIDDDTQGRGSVTYEVYLDDRMAYETPILRSKDLWHIDVPIPAGTKTVRLVLTVGPDDYNYDWGDWINAGFATGK
jgi:hypothetical protein